MYRYVNKKITIQKFFGFNTALIDGKIEKKIIGVIVKDTILCYYIFEIKH